MFIQVYEYFTVLVFFFTGFLIVNYFFKKNSRLAFQAYLFRFLNLILFTAIYTYHYKGGDTMYYWSNTNPFINLLKTDLSTFIKIYFGAPSYETYSLFTYDSGIIHPEYFFDNKTFLVVKINLLFNILGFGSYLNNAYLVALSTFIVLFKFYETLQRYYFHPYHKYAILFIPSVAFWGSPILKDTFTFAGLLMVVDSLIILFHQKLTISRIIYLILGVLLIINIKPYIFVALLPSTLLWFTWRRIQGIKSPLFKLVGTPLIIISVTFGGAYLWNILSPSLGVYGNLDTIAQKSHISYMDLKQSYYKGNSFDLGYYDPTVQGMLSKFFPATVTGLFRPFIWEVKNFTMLLAGLENLLILLYTLFVVFHARWNILKFIASEPFLIFCFLFSIAFAFSIAISTSNFGAMVRFKIPLLPFYFILLNMLYEKSKAYKIRWEG